MKDKLCRSCGGQRREIWIWLTCRVAALPLDTHILSRSVPFRPPVLSLLLFYTNVYFGGGIYYVKNDIFRGVIMMAIYHFQWLPSVAWTDQLRTFCCSCRWLWVFAIGQSARETEIHSSGAHYLWPLTIIINKNTNGLTTTTEDDPCGAAAVSVHILPPLLMRILCVTNRAGSTVDVVVEGYVRVLSLIKHIKLIVAATIIMSCVVLCPIHCVFWEPSN